MPLPRIPAKPLTAELPSFSPRLVGDLLSTWMEIWAIYYLSIVFYCEIIKPMLLMNARKNLFNVISIVKTLVGLLWQRGIPIRLYVKEEWWWWWNRVPSASWYWVAVSAPSRLAADTSHLPTAYIFQTSTLFFPCLSSANCLIIFILIILCAFFFSSCLQKSLVASLCSYCLSCWPAVSDSVHTASFVHNLLLLLSSYLDLNLDWTQQSFCYSQGLKVTVD